MVQDHRERCARIRSSHPAAFDAKRAIARRGRNLGLTLRPVERERNVVAVAFADDAHLMSLLTNGLARCQSWGVRLIGLDDNCGAVAEDLRGAHHRARVVSNTHDSICADSSGMREHELK